MKRLVKWMALGFALFLFLLLINIKVVLEARVGGENSGLHIEVILLGRLLRREFTLKDLRMGLERGEPTMGWKQKEEAARDKTLSKNWRRMALPDVRRRLVHLIQLGREFKRRPWLERMARLALRIKALNWKTVVGLEDAMHTALTAGAIWSLKGWFLALASCLGGISEQRIEVLPSFGSRKVESVFHCEILFRLGPILIVIIAGHILYRRALSSISPPKNQESCVV